ncbi:hypothetical protein GOODEAATRI_018808 [Goodea atripinnis]|uniref:Uncharacterized protein n=1 Tax=Goodea atripinnis TaxID=208336 RepID=A0ABV0PF61_9TELE
MKTSRDNFHIFFLQTSDCPPVKDSSAGRPVQQQCPPVPQPGLWNVVLHCHGGDVVLKAADVALESLLLHQCCITEEMIQAHTIIQRPTITGPGCRLDAALPTNIWRTGPNDPCSHLEMDHPRSLWVLFEMLPDIPPDSLDGFM